MRVVSRCQYAFVNQRTGKLLSAPPNAGLQQPPQCVVCVRAQIQNWGTVSHSHILLPGRLLRNNPLLLLVSLRLFSPTLSNDPPHVKETLPEEKQNSGTKKSNLRKRLVADRYWEILKFFARNIGTSPRVVLLRGRTAGAQDPAPAGSEEEMRGSTADRYRLRLAETGYCVKVTFRTQEATELGVHLERERESGGEKN